MSIPNKNCVDTLLALFKKTTKSRNCVSVKLGKVNNDQIVFIKSNVTSGPKVLLAAGFHGNEPAGCWGLLKFFEEASSDIFNSACISILPIVNPSGLRKNCRYNNFKENPNRGLHPKSNKKPSAEGKILLNNLDVLKSCASDGFLSLHEDVDCNGFYAYVAEKNNKHNSLSPAIANTGTTFFPQHANGTFGIGTVLNGIVIDDNNNDGFENRLFGEGTLCTVCTETPGKANFNQRVTANAALSKTFVQYCSLHHT